MATWSRLPMLSKEEISAFLAREFPQTKCVIESLGDGEALLSHPVGEEELRPGGNASSWRAGGLLVQFFPQDASRARMVDLHPGDAPGAEAGQGESGAAGAGDRAEHPAGQAQ